jgi:hypothetical protein
MNYQNLEENNKFKIDSDIKRSQNELGDLEREINRGLIFTHHKDDEE